MRHLCINYLTLLDARKWCYHHKIHPLWFEYLPIAEPIKMNTNEAMNFLRDGFSAIRDELSKSDLTFINVLIPHRIINGDIFDMQDLAIRLGYKYFSWNGRIYLSETLEDTGRLLGDVK